MVCPRRAGVPFCLPHKKEPKKVTAEGTWLPWLALRRRRGKLAPLRCAQTVPLFAPDAAPSLRPNPLGGALTMVRSVIATAINRRLGEASVKKSADEGRSRTSSV